MEISVDERKFFGVLLKNLSKAFDCLSHSLLLVKLHAYGFNFSALKLMHNYLKNKEQ